MTETSCVKRMWSRTESLYGELSHWEMFRKIRKINYFGVNVLCSFIY